MKPQLPELPEAIEVEIELTNHCNAQCVACPRHELTAPKGLMPKAVFDDILDAYVEQRPRMRINQIIGRPQHPFITLAGMGEPLCHPELIDFIAAARARSFPVVLFTNGSLVTEALAQKIAASDLKSLYISFWGIEKKEYEASMGLPYEQTLERVERLCELCKQRGISTDIIWVQTDHITSTPEAIDRFWAQRGISVDHENIPWNRAGYMPGEFRSHLSVDFDKPVWCSQLYFTDTYCWNGDAIICSCDYYKKQHVLKHSSRRDLRAIAAAKMTLLQRGRELELCQNCLKPDRNYGFASAPWDDVLSDAERSRYEYRPGCP